MTDTRCIKTTRKKSPRLEPLTNQEADADSDETVNAEQLQNTHNIVK